MYTHVELSSWCVISLVQRDDLVAKEVLSRRNAGWQGEVDLSTVGDHPVDAPRLVVYVQTVLPYLKPRQVGDIWLECVVYLGTASNEIETD